MVILPRNNDFSLVSLPLLQDPRTDAYIKSVEIAAAKHNRVWVVAPDRPSDYFNGEMITEFGFRPFRRFSSNGKIQVTLLQGTIDQSRTK